MNSILKKVLAFLVAACSACALFACQDPTVDNNADGNGDESSKTVADASTIEDIDHTIIFYSTQGDALQAKTQIAIDAFEAKYPGWKVVHSQVGGYDDVKKKIVGDLQGGIQPDLAYCYSDHVAQYLQTKKVIDLSTLINSTEQINGATVGYTAEEISDFVEGYYKEGFATNYGDYDKYGYSKDAVLTLPFVKSTELLYYNADALKSCGLEPAQTWDELWSQCEVLRQRYPQATVLGYDSEANWFITMCQQNGWGYTSAEGNHYLFNNDQAKAWVSKLNDYYEDAYLTTQSANGAYTSALFTQGVEGGIIYCIGSSGGASYQSTNNFKWGVTTIPGSVKSDGSVDRSAISQGPSLVMLQCDQCSNKDEKAKMTFLFVKELLDPRFQAEFSIQSGYNPCRKSTYEVDEYKEHLDGENITAIAAKVASTMTDNFFTSPAFIGSSEARTQVGNVVYYVMTGQKDAETALSDAYKNCGGK